MEVYRQRLLNKDPFIVENGGAIYQPMGYFMFLTGSKKNHNYVVSEFGKPYEEIRRMFQALRDMTAIAVKGFGDMTPEEIARLTGLPVDEAELAKQREFGEPFIFEHGPDTGFLKAIEKTGLRWTQGRIFHVMSGYDKGTAARLLKWWYKSEFGEIRTIGLGDGFNDLPMLREMDHPVLVQKTDGSYDSRIEVPGLIKAKGIGPAGWNSALLELLQQ